MEAKDFNSIIDKICSEKSFDFKPEYEGQVRYLGDTPFGKMQIISDPSPEIGVYSVFMRFLEDFEVSDFLDYFGKYASINKYSKKWNFHNKSADCVLQEVVTRLNALQSYKKV